MIVLEDRKSLNDWVEQSRLRGGKVGFIPTMGALHEGHLSLVREARKSCSQTIVSIFVNPTQFGPGEDFDQYPRTFVEDKALLEDISCDAIFLPSPEVIYPPGGQTFITVEPLASQLCGASRPGHFQGVATVVTILLNLVRPHAAYFGVKDYQQLTLIKQMVRDLALAVEVVGVPIVREKDGLALSSRNRYLTTEERKQAAALYKALCTAKSLYKDGELRAKELEQAARGVLLESGIEQIDYVEVRDKEKLTSELTADDPVMLIAARVGKTRLIDNMVLST
ncbi:MAG: pantoate--beta-alanine ligase [Magnetococcales bacterium]|nr:pantoate--beta-alanine ligase [Magnetococcales bacterium]